MTKAKGKADNDPALGTLLDDRAARLRAIQVTDGKLVSGRDQHAKALQDQATATRGRGAATTPAAKATASAQIKAARADQDRLGPELLAACT